MSLVASKVYIDLPGGRINNLPGAELDLGGEANDAVETDNGIAGFKTKIIPGKLTVKIAYTSDVNPAEIRALKDINIPVETEHGHLFMMNGARQETPPKFSGGEISMVWVCKTVELVS